MPKKKDNTAYTTSDTPGLPKKASASDVSTNTPAKRKTTRRTNAEIIASHAATATTSPLAVQVAVATSVVSQADIDRQTQQIVMLYHSGKTIPQIAAYTLLSEHHIALTLQEYRRSCLSRLNPVNVKQAIAETLSGMDLAASKFLEDSLVTSGVGALANLQSYVKTLETKIKVMEKAHLLEGPISTTEHTSPEQDRLKRLLSSVDRTLELENLEEGLEDV